MTPNFPSLPDSYLAGLASDGRRVIASSVVNRILYDRARWLAEKKPAIHVNWGEGKDCPTLSSSSSPFAVTVSDTTVRNEWVLGHAYIPAVGNTTGAVTLYARQDEYSSGTLRVGMRVRHHSLYGATETAPRSWIDLGTFSLGSSNGWRSGSFTVPDMLFDAPLEVLVYLTTWNGSASSSAQAAIVAWSLCSAGTAWGRDKEDFGHFRRSNVPEDVATLRLLRDYQDSSAAVPRVLANHSFMPQVAAGANQPAFYIIPAPLHGASLTVHAYCRTTGGSAANLRVACDTSDTTTSFGAMPTADNSSSFTSATLAWRTVTVTPTAGQVNYLYVWVDPDVADTADLRAVYVSQAETPDGDLTYGVPGWHLLPVSARDMVPGAEIIASYSGEHADESILAEESIQNLWTDRFTSANNAKWWPQARGSVVVPGDWVVVGDTFTGGFTSGKALTHAVTPRWGARDMTCAIRMSTDDVAIPDDERLQARPAYNSSTLPGATVFNGSPGGPAWDRYRQFGFATLSPGTTAYLTIGAGWTDLNDAPVTAATDGRVAAVSAWERPPANLANVVHVRGYVAPGSAIPDNDTVTGVSSTIAVTRSLRLGYVRARVTITHAAAATLRITLGDGTTTRRLADFGDLSGSGTQTFSFSDGYEDDTTPDEALEEFKGDTSVATWTLTVYDNTAGNTGTLVAWSLELW